MGWLATDAASILAKTLIKEIEFNTACVPRSREHILVDRRFGSNAPTRDLPSVIGTDGKVADPSAIDLANAGICWEYGIKEHTKSMGRCSN